MLDRSSVVVIVVAAVTGVALARGAGAVVPGAEEGPSRAVMSRATAAAPATGTSSLGTAAAAIGAALRDDSEPEEPRAVAPGENPYDEAPARAGVAKVPVALQGGMLHLPGGRFVMGSSNPRAPANERPSRTLSVTTFWIDRTEVTVGAYRSCVDAHACARPERTSANCTFDAGDPELPVACVHWRDADAYCRFSSKRLPSELEWEYAARGTFAVALPWGGPASCANAVTLINDQSGKSCAPRPTRVGTHPGGASVFGVHDMSGNVEEWTADWYAESAGPTPRAGSAHVLRGGGWLSPPSLSRTTARNWGSAVEAGPNVGFRCARDD